MANVEEVENMNEDSKAQTKEKAQLSKQINLLNEYIKQMAYKPIQAPLASENTENLARSKAEIIVAVDDENRQHFLQKERADRVARIAAKLKPISTDQMADFIAKYRKKQDRTERISGQLNLLYQQTIMKLRKQCEDQLMHAVVRKFAEKISKSASLLLPDNLITESYQNLQQALVCNMYIALQLPNNEQLKDFELYNKLAAVLADIILQALFLVQNTNNVKSNCKKDIVTEISPENIKKDHCIQLRALRAAKKKLQSKRHNLISTELTHIY